jgi:serine/threonine protein kinase
LVQDVAGATPRPRIMNWQTGTREGTQSSDTVDPARRTVGGTMHVEEYVEDPGLVYLAPETSQAEAQHGPSLDVFSLGAITYHVFSGRPPAGSVLELAEKLRIGQGLRLSDVLDGCGKQLQDLIQYSTNPDVMGRYGTVDEFLQDLDKVVDELTTPEPEATVDPAEAKPEERIEGGFTVIRKMGRGSSADVLLVRVDGSTEEMVLKVALDASLNDRLTAEGEALSKLRHPNIVEWQRTLTVNGRTALLMRKAGDTTLSHRIREEARLSLDLLQRFGEELIQAVDYLEQQGVAHRDIKPDNIGMSQAGTKGKLQLVLFDFSLTRTSPRTSPPARIRTWTPSSRCASPRDGICRPSALPLASRCTRWSRACCLGGVMGRHRHPCSIAKPPWPPSGSTPCFAKASSHSSQGR